MAQPLTKRQAEIVAFLGRYIAEHGYAQSLEEIGRHFGLSALATVHKHLTNIEDKGHIRRQWNRSRSIELLAQHGTCPTCGQPMPTEATP